MGLIAVPLEETESRPPRLTVVPLAMAVASAISVPALLMAVAIDLPPTRSCLLPELIVVTIAVPPEPTCCRPWLLIVVTLASRLTD
jgi:hypothetical protein